MESLGIWIGLAVYSFVVCIGPDFFMDLEVK